MSFLELFCDLVYVVVIAEIGHFLATHIGLTGLWQSAFLFTLVWLAWMNGASYHDIHGQNDIRTRVATFAQMIPVAAMAVFAHSAFGEGATGFALSFAVYQVIVGVLWWRTGVHEPEHRPLSAPYTAMVLLSAVCFAASVFVSDRFLVPLWGAGLLLTALAPVAVNVLPTNDPSVRAQRERAFTLTSSAVERFGLFAIIVLGEVIVAVVQGVASHHDLNRIVGIAAVLGMLLAIGLWWLYFDYVSHRKPKVGFWPTACWLYLHLAVTMGITATGSATLHIIEHTGDPVLSGARWLLVGAIAMTVASIAVTIWVVRVPEEAQSAYQTAGWVALGSAVAVAALGLTSLDAIPLLSASVVLLLLPVFYGIRVWIKDFDAQEITIV